MNRRYEENGTLVVAAAILPVVFPDEDGFGKYRGKDVTAKFRADGIYVDEEKLTGKAKTFARNCLKDLPL